MLRDATLLFGVGVGGVGIGHGYFSTEKFRDPTSRRRAPVFDSPGSSPKTKTAPHKTGPFLFLWRWGESNPRAEKDVL